jgi:hypothetical protein
LLLISWKGLLMQKTLAGILLVTCFFPAAVFAERPKGCIAPDEAAAHLKKDVCIEAHVYDVVELPDGTRFLDVCPPDTLDEKCRFTIVSLREDRVEVGELQKFRDTDVHIRGLVQPMHGRNGIMLSHVRQFYGGPPKFRPNPKLLHGFSGDQAKPPVADLSLRPHGGHRAFMNSREQQTLPGK